MNNLSKIKKGTLLIPHKNGQIYCVVKIIGENTDIKYVKIYNLISKRFKDQLFIKDDSTNNSIWKWQILNP